MALKTLVDHMLANPDVTIDDLNAWSVEWRPVLASVVLDQLSLWNVLGDVQFGINNKLVPDDLAKFWLNLIEKLKLLQQSGMTTNFDEKLQYQLTDTYNSAGIDPVRITNTLDLSRIQRTVARATFGDDVTPELVALAETLKPTVQALNDHNAAVEEAFRLAKEGIQSVVEKINVGDAEGAADLVAQVVVANAEVIK